MLHKFLTISLKITYFQMVQDVKISLLALSNPIDLGVCIWLD
jgi:hypothetical protein